MHPSKAPVRRKLSLVLYTWVVGESCLGTFFPQKAAADLIIRFVRPVLYSQSWISSLPAYSCKQEGVGEHRD